MSKATVIMVDPPVWHNPPGEGYYRSKCLCTKVRNPTPEETFYLYFHSKNEAGGTTWGLPMRGDNVQYFDNEIHKIVSRPVERKSKMQHDVMLGDQNCSRNPTLGQLQGGTIFKLPTGTRLYMVLGGDGIAKSPSIVRYVNLSNGDVYGHEPDKAVVPVSGETKITICTDANNKS